MIFPTRTEKEEEINEFNIHVSRYRPEELTKLAKTTKFTRKEIQLIYRGFKQECPSGMLDEESFVHIFAQFFPQGDATQYAHYVFNTIKHSQTSKITFELIDTNKDGVVTIDELIQWCSRDEGILKSLETLDTIL
ncbi:hypothetical protein M8J76_016663 [Diaphorina citri]|nr:hypothetical protein M8J76_016663 [Diaphorina citri]